MNSLIKRRVKDIAVKDIAVKDKGLRKNALSFLSNMVIGVASAAPAYSIASALGPIAGSASFAAPAILIVAFIPMLCIAAAYYYLNRVDPDCGTTFSWVTLAMGPSAGWVGGWMLLMTNIIVMPSMAVIAGEYSFLLCGVEKPSALLVTAAGAAWIVLLTWVCYAGIELSARTQQVLLGTELAVLLLFAGVAFAKVSMPGAPPDAMPVSLAWFNPFETASYDGFLKAFLVAVFIYWGWDSSLAVNEETENPKTTPGRAGVASTFLLAAVYVLVAAAALSFAGPRALSAGAESDASDIFAGIGEGVLGGWLDKLLVLAVLTSAAAATQTTILPAARTALSMASAGAIPARFAEIEPRTKSPAFATIAMGAVSVLWFVFLRSLSKNVLDDSIEALGLCIAFYYALTGFACVIVYRREMFRSAANFLAMGVVPALGGAAMVFLLVESALSLARNASVLPLAIAAASLVAGLILMLAARRALPAFFRR